MSAPILHYHGSKGPVLISDMATPHLRSAHAKLVRERLDDSRDAEIATMADHLAQRDAEYVAEQAANGGAGAVA
jgi:hypothetical protein